MTGPGFRKEPPMETLPPGGIENVESSQDPARNRMDEDPTVRYTVKELIVRLDQKLDSYLADQRDLRETVGRIEPLVTALDVRLERIELAELARKAVKTWRQDTWRLMAGTSGLVAFAALGVALFHH